MTGWVREYGIKQASHSFGEANYPSVFQTVSSQILLKGNHYKRVQFFMLTDNIYNNTHSFYFYVYYLVLSTQLTLFSSSYLFNVYILHSCW